MYLIEVIRRALVKTGESPTWAEAQLLAIRQERGNIEGMADALHKRLGTTWRNTIDAAYLRGQLDAERELANVPETLIPNRPIPQALNTAAVYALTSEAITTMEPVHRNLVRRVEDIWKRIGVEATGYSISGAMTTQQAAQRAFTRLAREGLPFFVDKRGRKWGLDTYAEMAVRTMTNKALRAGHTDTMVQHGIDLVVVSSHKNPAPQCAPFERKVLSLTGKYSAGTHRIGGNIVNVKGTMRDAEASGLHHPNCRHTHSGYVPGYTRVSDAPYDGDDSGYKATQKQRYLERQIRASKRMEAAAIDEADVRAARQRKNAYQAKLRDHVAKHDLPRRRHREQLRQPASGAVGLSFDD
nr:MAG TPA_asm: minor capsid protein [Caudoviricetes sp.]